MSRKKHKKKLFVKYKKKQKNTTDICDNSTQSSSYLYIYFLIFILFSISFASYPGNSYYINLFAYKKEVFEKKIDYDRYNIKPVVYVINPNITPYVTARSVYVIERQTATPIFEKNIHDKLFPASTAKILTAITARDHFKLQDVLEVKRVIKEGQTAGFIKGERLSFENVLYALLVHSGNDAAYVIADNWNGGYKSFISDVNKKAKELFMRNTSIKNPAGLDEKGQYTTAFDLSLAARHLLSDKELSRIVSIKNITISDVDFKNFHVLSNVNKLLGEIPGIGGLKTGYTENAMENLVTLYRYRGHDFIIVILKSEDRFEDTKLIVDWIKTNVGFFSLED